MRTIFLAAIAVMSLGAAAANAQSLSHSAPPLHGSQYNLSQNGGG